jgi:hypothetical protein
MKYHVITFEVHAPRWGKISEQRTVAYQQILPKVYVEHAYLPACSEVVIPDGNYEHLPFLFLLYLLSKITLSDQIVFG